MFEHVTLSTKPVQYKQKNLSTLLSMAAVYIWHSVPFLIQVWDVGILVLSWATSNQDHWIHAGMVPMVFHIKAQQGERDIF